MGRELLQKKEIHIKLCDSLYLNMANLADCLKFCTAYMYMLLDQSSGTGSVNE